MRSDPDMDHHQIVQATSALLRAWGRLQTASRRLCTPLQHPCSSWHGVESEPLPAAGARRCSIPVRNRGLRRARAHSRLEDSPQDHLGAPCRDSCRLAAVRKCDALHHVQVWALDAKPASSTKVGGVMRHASPRRLPPDQSGGCDAAGLSSQARARARSAHEGGTRLRGGLRRRRHPHQARDGPHPIAGACDHSAAPLALVTPRLGSEPSSELVRGAHIRELAPALCTEYERQHFPRPELRASLAPFSSQTPATWICRCLFLFVPICAFLLLEQVAS